MVQDSPHGVWKDSIDVEEGYLACGGAVKLYGTYLMTGFRLVFCHKDDWSD